MSKIEHIIDILSDVCYNKDMVKSAYEKATMRTRRKIREAFAELLAERGAVKDITVTDLAERAEITRGTLYNYYNNIYEVGAEIQNEIEKQIFSDYYMFNTVDDVEQYLEKVFDFLEQQEDIYRELLVSDAPTGFLSHLEKEVSERVLMLMHENGVHDKNAEFELLFLTNGTFAIVRKYYRGEVGMTLPEICDYLKTKLRSMFDKYIK